MFQRTNAAANEIQTASLPIAFETISVSKTIFEKKVMSAFNDFNTIVESIYNLPLEDKQELKDMLEQNIIETRRDEIALNYKSAQKEYKENKLKFSSTIKELKKML